MLEEPDEEPEIVKDLAYYIDGFESSALAAERKEGVGALLNPCLFCLRSV